MSSQGKWSARPLISYMVTPSGRHTFVQAPVVAFVAAALAIASTRSQAEPITFGFDTNIASVTSGISFPGSGVELPFNPEIGNRLLVQFTFQPANGGAIYAQNQQMLIQIDEFVLKANSFDISVGNNRPDWTPLTGRIADPANTPIVDRGPGGVRDDFSLACNVVSGVSCGTVPGANNIEWRVQILLAGDPTVLNSNDLTADLDNWNAMSFREMSLLFIDVQSGRTGSLGAFVGSIGKVPEPSMAGYILGATVVVALMRVRMTFLH